MFKKIIKRSLAALLTCVMTFGAFAPVLPVNAASKKTTATAVAQVLSVDQTTANVNYKVKKVKKICYQISTDSTFKTNVKTVKVKNSKKTTNLALTGLNSDTTYYFRVKGLLTTKTEKRKYKVKWSKAVSFKTTAPVVNTTPAPGTDTTPATDTKPGTDTTPTIEFKLKQTEITLKQHQMISSTVLLPDGVNPDEVRWTTPDGSIADCDFGDIYVNDIITTITMTATYAGQTAQLTIHIIENPDLVME